MDEHFDELVNRTNEILETKIYESLKKGKINLNSAPPTMLKQLLNLSIELEDYEISAIIQNEFNKRGI
jgi:hypothetical protein